MLNLARKSTLALFAASIAFTPVAAFAGKDDDTLVAAFQAKLPSLDRYHSPGREGFLLGLLAYDALVYRDPNTFELKPLLATAWKQVDDKTWEFDLRQGVKFHNGDPMTAEDVAYSFMYAAEPANKVFNRMTGGWIEKIEIVDPFKVRVVGKQVTPLALEYIIQLPIVPKKYRESVGLQGFAEKPVGTGPYKISGGSGNDVIFTRNDDYFEGGGKNKPHIKTLVYRAVPDVNTQVAELISGGVDWAYYIPADQADRLKMMPMVDVVNADTFRIGFLTLDAAGLSDAKSPLKDVRVRQAIAHAVNRDAMAKSLVGGASKTVPSACTPSQFGCFADVAQYGYDVEKAKALMAEAGYADGFDIDIYGYRSRPVAEAIIGYLGAIGIRANLHWLQYSAVIQQRRDHKTPIVIDDFGSAGVNDVGAILPFFFAESPDDQSRDPVVTQAVKDAGAIADPEKRKELYATALKQIADQAYWVPMFSMPVNYVTAKDVTVPVPGDENVEFWRATWK
ncbi:peptide/nickel transport system substrate-binding protein [Rhizobium sp. BIGb0125]|jgi:peptide/nickel transport system substrate-binding protein|uniref:ABC transporter substrate-binding protein n=1 Tax=Rhizobium sp. BIGb0125 TaxID=2940618 RepID=UPI0021687AEC|nr:ABC transporter substrate-binding protein [Rhizobium sp. BIGb0125]MCS4244059.1 peptide/nickel transport system substrate-binding protein [Rhizobium sp. BIGb0125]